MRIISIDPLKCVGCHNCQLACSFKNIGDFDLMESKIRVNIFLDDMLCVPMTCVHCKEAFCMDICPSGAIQRDEKTGAVTIDHQVCVGCKMCMLACPFGNIYYRDQGQICYKCDLCGGEPNCVKFCISGALQYVEEEDAFSDNRIRFDERIKDLLKVQGDSI